MSKSDAFEAAILDLLFLNVNIANLGDAGGLRGSVAPGQLFVAFHTADPGEAGSAQTTSEVSYTGYARAGVARSGAGWVRTGNIIRPAATVNLPQCTAGTQTATHFSIGIAATGAGMILYKGTLNPNIAIAPSVTPQLASDTTITED